MREFAPARCEAEIFRRAARQRRWTQERRSRRARMKRRLKRKMFTTTRGVRARAPSSARAPYGRDGFHHPPDPGDGLLGSLRRCGRRRQGADLRALHPIGQVRPRCVKRTLPLAPARSRLRSRRRARRDATPTTTRAVPDHPIRFPPIESPVRASLRTTQPRTGTRPATLSSAATATPAARAPEVRCLTFSPTTTTPSFRWWTTSPRRARVR